MFKVHSGISIPRSKEFGENESAKEYPVKQVAPQAKAYSGYDLFTAVKANHFATVDSILLATANSAQSAEWNQIYEGETSLTFAITHRHNKIARHLIHKGVDINTPNAMGDTPLDLALRFKRAVTAGLLISKGAKLSKGTLEIYFTDAIERNDIALVESMLAARASKSDAFNLQYKIGKKTFLDLAFSLKHTAIAERLIEESLKQKILTSEECLIKAIKADCFEIVEGLITGKLAEPKASVNFELKGETPLICAVKLGHEKITRYLVLQGAKIQEPNKHKLTALDVALQRSNTTISEFLIKEALKQKTLTLRECFTKALKANNFEIVDAFATNKITTELVRYHIYDVDIEGESSLTYAIKKGFLKIAKSLMKRSLMENKQGQRALTLAMQHKYTEIAELLIQASMDSYSIHKSGFSAELEILNSEFLNLMLENSELKVQYWKKKSLICKFESLPKPLSLELKKEYDNVPIQ